MCRERRLTCTVPGNVPGQSCAGLWAAGTGTGQETAPPRLHRGPAAQEEATHKHKAVTLSDSSEIIIG